MKVILFSLFLISSSIFSAAQTVAGKLKLNQGQVLDITLHLKTTIAQQAMGQAIDFNVEGKGEHSYTVTNTTEDNSTLHHRNQRITFSFDGMGQKRNFDSQNEKDMKGQFGKPVKELMEKEYDMIIDPAGKVKMVRPEKLDSVKMDDRLAIITNMLKDVLDIVQPPQKGSSSIFSVLPETELSKGGKWSDTVISSTLRGITNYTIEDINDSTVVIDVSGTSVSVSKAEMMGNAITTTMNNKLTGKIKLDRLTGIFREKNLVTESNGSSESTFGNLPVTSRTTILMVVNPGK
jgi:hypothetical protein